jgi:hypothetical protein
MRVWYACLVCVSGMRVWYACLVCVSDLFLQVTILRCIHLLLALLLMPLSDRSSRCSCAYLKAFEGQADLNKHVTGDSILVCIHNINISF